MTFGLRDHSSTMRPKISNRPAQTTIDSVPRPVMGRAETAPTVGGFDGPPPPGRVDVDEVELVDDVDDVDEVDDVELVDDVDDVDEVDDVELVDDVVVVGSV
jgi:hypothetical protein